MNCILQKPRPATMRFGKREFRPRLVPTIATLVLLPILISLGFWQIDRAQEKRAIQERFEHRTHQPPLALGPRLESPTQVHYRRVTVRGTYDAKHQLLIDNQVYQGRAGYYVVTPLHIEHTDTWVLVNRGWAPQGATRSDLPALPVPTGAIEVNGLAELPDGKPLFVGNRDRENQGWPAVVLWLDLDRYAKATGYRLQPFEILQDPEDAGSYPRHWRIVTLPPEKSVSYAVQWFTMAFALVVIYLVVNTHRVTPSGGATDEPEQSDAGEPKHE